MTALRDLQPGDRIKRRDKTLTVAKIETEVRFWSQVIGDSKRTILCSPDLESRIKGWIDARGMGALYTVLASPACQDERIYVIDEQAITADWNSTIQKTPIRFRW